MTVDRPWAVLFDLDGTLVDSFPGIAAAYHHLLVELDLGDRDDDQLREFVGPPIQAVLEERFGLSGDRLAEGMAVFRRHYGSEGLLRFSVYPGVDDLLRELHRLGVELRIATSKLRTMALEVVEHAGWTDLFTVVGGAEPGGSRHLKRDVIEWTLGQGRQGVRTVAMVGDRGVDLTAGREFGLPGVGVTWGYGSMEELVEAGAAAMADAPDELLWVLGRLASADQAPTSVVSP